MSDDTVAREESSATPSARPPVSLSGALVDADRFLTLTERLRALRERIDGSPENDRRRGHWQRLLVAASDTAKTDLDRADEKLTRLEAEVDRFLRGS